MTTTAPDPLLNLTNQTPAQVFVTEEEKQAARQPVRGISSGDHHSAAPIAPPPRRTAAAPAAASVPTVTAQYDFESSVSSTCTLKATTKPVLLTLRFPFTHTHRNRETSLSEQEMSLS